MQSTARSMYPESLGVEMDPKHAYWFQWLANDVTFLQCALFSTSAAHDFVRYQFISPMTYSLLSKAIATLNTTLSQNTSISLLDSTIYVVIMLATFAGMMGDRASAEAHAAGLRQMVRLRGGLECFQDNVKMCIQIGR